jgi:FtsH-binding integral membrane protein
MFLGHFAVALAAKRIAPRASLGTLVAAAQLIDLAWPALVLAGLEVVRIDPGNTAYTPLDFVSYPFSHGAASVLLWAALLGGGYFALRRYQAGAWTVAGLVASHWVLDWLTHRPDLPLWPGGPKAGLGLWNSVPATVVVETALFAAGSFLYGRTTRWRDGVGRFGLYGFLALLLAISVANLAGPPPPSVEAIGFAGLGLWLFVALAAWIDRHRVVRETIDVPVRD